jgi:hypothetical protein
MTGRCNTTYTALLGLPGPAKVSKGRARSPVVGPSCDASFHCDLETATHTHSHSTDARGSNHAPGIGHPSAAYGFPSDILKTTPDIQAEALPPLVRPPRPIGKIGVEFIAGASREESGDGCPRGQPQSLVVWSDPSHRRDRHRLFPDGSAWLGP